jgi:hypothetical protein
MVQEEVTPELSSLRDNLVRYEMATASERIAVETKRMERDRFLATCRDVLHSTLKEVGPIDPKKIHQVIDAIDDYLNREKGLRK